MSFETIEERIFDNAEQYFERLITLINSAHHSIYLESYIFDDDFVGQAIAQALESAALRGVKVRVLVDGVGAGWNFANIAKQLNQCGAEVRVFRPLPWRLELWPFSLFPRKGLLKLWYLFSYINQRNHRKVLIVDNKVAVLGSLNITKDHLGLEQGGKGFRDTAIEVTGTNLTNLELVFNAVWSHERKKKLAAKLRSSPFRYNFTRALRAQNKKDLLSRIDSANETIWISNAYFIPDSKLLKSLINASKRGVDVRLLAPGTSDIIFIPWASSYFYSSLIKAGIRVYELEEKVLHTKTLIIDSWASIGSSNLNTRSFMHDLELDYSIQLESSLIHLTDQFVEDCRHSSELNLKCLGTKHFWRRNLGGLLLLLFSYWV